MKTIVPQRKIWFIRPTFRALSNGDVKKIKKSVQQDQKYEIRAKQGHIRRQIDPLLVLFLTNPTESYINGKSTLTLTF